MTRGDGIVILDSEGLLVVDADPFVTDLLGCAREGLVGCALETVDFLADPALRAGLIEEVGRGGYACRRSLPAKTCDGRRLLVDVVAHSYLANDRTVIQLNISDVTDRDRDRDAGVPVDVHKVR